MTSQGKRFEVHPHTLRKYWFTQTRQMRESTQEFMGGHISEPNASYKRGLLTDQMLIEDYSKCKNDLALNPKVIDEATRRELDKTKEELKKIIQLETEFKN